MSKLAPPRQTLAPRCRGPRPESSILKKKLLISVVSFGLTVLALEVSLRLAFWPYITQIYVLDDRCLFRPKPSSAHYHRQIPPNEGPNILVSIDADGYRGPDREVPEGALRAVVFGDSFVIAEFSAWENTYGAQLERELAATLGRPAFVVNAGTAGGGPDQYVIRLEAELPRLAPDLVIVAIFAGNDFGDLLRNKLFRLGDAGELVPNEFALSQKVRDRFSVGDGSAIARTVSWMRTNRRMQRGWESMQTSTRQEYLRVAHGLMENDLGLCRDQYDDYVERGGNEIRTLLEDQYDADIALDPDSRSASHKVRMMEAVMQRIVAIVRGAGVPLMFVSIPAPHDAIADYSAGTADTQKFPNYRASRLTDEVTRIARTLEVPCLDLFAPFRARGAELYLLAPDNHWNDEGQRVAARLTRDLIVSEQLLDR